MFVAKTIIVACPQFSILKIFLQRISLTYIKLHS